VRLKLTLEYDGTGFRGWATQPGLRTVEGVVREALEALYSDVGALSVAGRTDAGVHALGQVVSADVAGGPPPDRASDALNAVLPDDVSVVAAGEAPSGFHARHSARARTYRYRVFRRRARSPFEVHRGWWYPLPVDLGALAETAHLLQGEHDFRAFTPTETHHKDFHRSVRSARWYERDTGLELEITADRFLRHMLRTLVGTMLELGAAAPERLPDLLEGRERAAAGMTAPPWGLYLVEVEYGPTEPRSEAVGGVRLQPDPGVG
jgi:tRNA pseudouridine38-40 synthase